MAHHQVTRADAQRKNFDGLRAELALAGGFALSQMADGTYLVTRWNLGKHCTDLQEVSAFLRQVTGARP